MTRSLRYSERRELAELGGRLLQDEPSAELRHALLYLLGEGEARQGGRSFRAAAHAAAVKHFGWPNDSMNVRTAVLESSGDGFLDLIEIICETGSAEYEVIYRDEPVDWRVRKPFPNLERELNDLFDRHRLGYRLESGDIRKVGSPVLDELVIVPALLAVRRQGWDEVERSFREAIHHQRGGVAENDDALTAANAAVEAALKAAGFRGANLGPLAKDFKNSSVVPPELTGVPEALDVLLARLGALRSSHGDSHGKPPGAAEVPQELVDLAINWAGAFIVYLSAAAPLPS